MDSRKARLDENLGAVTLELSAADLQRLSAAAAQIALEGARCPARSKR